MMLNLRLIIKDSGLNFCEFGDVIKISQIIIYIGLGLFVEGNKYIEWWVKIDRSFSNAGILFGVGLFYH